MVKYVRLYGPEHKRTETQFKTTWQELQQGLPTDGDGFLLGVSDNKLLLDGIPLESGQAEQSFAKLLNTAGLASIHFSKEVTKKDFAQLVRAFAGGGTKAQNIARQVKDIFGGHKRPAIRVNEVKFVAADPATGEIAISAQLAAQNLSPEFKDWLSDPQKLLQLIAAAEGAEGKFAAGGVQLGSVPDSWLKTADSDENSSAQPQPIQSIAWQGGVVPLQEEEVVRAIRLLTRFGEASVDPAKKTDMLKQELTETHPNTKINLQQLLETLAATLPAQKTDTPLLVKAAEHMAIRFAMDRFQKGEVKVNAVHQMLEHMSRQMDTLRNILRVHEDKMSKAGLLVESHADILDRMFWAEVPESGKKSVLLSDEAPCVPPRNLRQFVELLLDRGDTRIAVEILKNYIECLGSSDPDGRRRTAVGLSQLADLFASPGVNLIGTAIAKLGDAILFESDSEIQTLLNASFVRLSSEVGNRRNFAALNQICASLEQIASKRPGLSSELQPRIGIENRLPQFIEEALTMPHLPEDLLAILRRNSIAAAEHLAERFFRCMRRDECDRMVELVKQLGPDALKQITEMVRTGQVRQAVSAVGLLSRLDVAAMLEILPTRLREWNRFYHDLVVRQIAYGAASDRGRSLLELLEILDPWVLPQAIDEIGMSGDRTAIPPLIVMAQAGETEGRSPLIQMKAVESLGRLRDPDCVPVLQSLLEAKKMWKWVHPRELRIAAAQALAKIEPHFAMQILAESDLEASELALAALDAAPGCPWVRQRRYERILLRKPLPATISSSWGRSAISIRELSLGGGMGAKEDNLRVGSEADIEISLGVRHVRGQVLLRRARVNEIGFELVNTDLESRYRLRRLLMDALTHSSDEKTQQWEAQRK